MKYGQPPANHVGRIVCAIVGIMDVFVVPIGAERYELYCEGVIESALDEPEAAGLIGRLKRRLATVLHMLEVRGHQRADDVRPEPQGFFGRMQDRLVGWMAERVAEQRLLWNLRRVTSAVVQHPSDVTFDQAMDIVRRALVRDYERHRRWTIVDGLLFFVTFVFLGPFFLLVPGIANLPALYFGFRVLTHALSMRGAAQGLKKVAWQGVPCAPLGELRLAVSLAPGARERRVHDIAERLHLRHLPGFLERVAITRA